MVGEANVDKLFDFSKKSLGICGIHSHNGTLEMHRADGSAGPPMKLNMKCHRWTKEGECRDHPESQISIDVEDAPERCQTMRLRAAS